MRKQKKFNTLVSLILVCAMLLSMLPQNILAVQAEEENVTGYVTNGGFEEGIESIGSNYLNVCVRTESPKIQDFGNTGWKFQTTNATNTGINYEIVEEGRDGTGHALKVSRPEGLTDEARAIFYQDFSTKFEKGATYQLSIWFKPVGVDAGLGYLRLAEYASSTIRTNTESVKKASNGQWVNKTLEFVATDNKYGLELNIENLNAGYFLVDDISITKIKDAEEVVPVITVKQETAAIAAGETYQLEASLEPADTVAEISWSSDDTAIATVDENGLVTAVAAGSTNITASISWNGQNITDSCAVTVSAQVVPPESIIMPRTQETVFVDETIQLCPKASNADATEGGWIFNSSDTSVATVDKDGIVTGISEGQCEITVSNEYNAELKVVCNLRVWKNALGDGGFEAGTADGGTWKFNNQNAFNAGTMKYEFVTDAENVYSGNKALKVYTTGETPAAVAVNWGGLKLKAGATYKFMARIKAENLSAIPGIYCRFYSWGADNVNFVNGGEIVGTVDTKNTDGWQYIEKNITINEAAVGEQMSIRIENGTGTIWIDEVILVEWKSVETVTLDTTTTYLEKDQGIALKATTAPADASDHSLLFESSNPSVATVDENGNVTAIGLGEAVITVTAINGGCKATCVVTVLDKYTELKGISIQETLELKPGSQEKLTVTYDPEDATAKDIVWESSDDTVAYVDVDGVVTGLKAGTATITAKAAGDISDSCAVTVTDSKTLLTQKAQLVANYGQAISGSLGGFVTNNTGSTEVTYQLWETTTNGSLEMSADGSYTYLPQNYGTEQTDKAVIIVSAGTETAMLEVEITIKQIDNSLLNLTKDSTLYITRDQLEIIRAEIKDETSLRYELWNNYKDYVDTLLKTSPDKYEDHQDDDGDPTNDDNYHALWMRPMGDRTAHLLWAYLFTGDEAYKEKCIEYAVTISSYPMWSTWDYYNEADLAAGHQAFSVALVYNWLYDELSQEEKDIIAKKLYHTCGKFMEKWEDSGKYMQNHMHIALSGLCASAMSLCIHADDVAKLHGVTEEEVKSNCAVWIQLVCDKVGLSFEAMPKDGSYHEGLGYYMYAMEYLLKSALLLDSNLNIDMFTNNGWLENSSEFFMNTVIPANSIGSGNSLIDYGASSRGGWYGPSHIYRVLAGLYKDETAQWIAQKFEDSNADVSSSTFWMGVLYADPQVEASVPEERSTLYHANELGIVVSRQNWSGDESLVFIRNGLPLGTDALNVMDIPTITSFNNESHSDPAQNGIILMTEGEYLLRSDGTTFKKTEYHNTLIIDGVGQMGEGEQGLDATEIYELYLKDESKPGYVVLDEKDTYNYIVGDATAAYRSSLGLKKFQRNIVLLKDENVMLVVDDIETLQDKELELRWFPEYTTVSEEYDIYTVYGNKYDMKFYPFTEETDTEYSDVTVKITSSSNRTDKVFRQTVKSNDWQNAVAFTWGASGESQTGVRYLKGEGDIHQFEVNNKIYTINVADNTVSVSDGKLDLPENEWVSDSTLSAIMFNGNAMEGFDSNTFTYNVEKSWKVDTLNILPITKGPNAAAKVTWDGSCPGTATIEVTSEDGKNTSVYTLKLKNDEGLLNIDGVTVEPNTSTIDTSCMFDSYIQETGSDRTWASKNLSVVTFDLGEAADVRKIDVAFNYSSRRIFYYDLMVSEDGEEWTWLTDKDGYGESTITTTEFRSDYCNIFTANQPVRARYVRFNLRCHNESGLDNAGGISSIQEISIYGTVSEPEVMVPEIIVSATDTSYTLGCNKVVTITSTGEFAKFESVEMDDTIVDKSNYTVKEGSTIVTFKTEYLETVSVGKHTVTLNYTDGSSVDSRLTILAKVNDNDNDSDTSDSSDTSDDSGSSDSSDASDDSGLSDSSDTSDDSGSSDSSDTSDDSSSSDSDNTGDSGNTEDSSNAVEDDDTEDTDSSAATASNSVESAPTGDDSNPLLWITFLIFSCAGVLIAIINAKRKKQ